ncbi:hypothetical protein GGR50DRAFT_701591 [Xylaria sp. CBS 124048]|nr:hypothetical protein GGR50DRAFT_701591 [Xylaria sp. CBS 124048]
MTPEDASGLVTNHSSPMAFEDAPGLGSPGLLASLGLIDNHSSPVAPEDAPTFMSRPSSPIIIEDAPGLSSVGSLSSPGSPRLIDNHSSPVAPEDAPTFMSRPPSPIIIEDTPGLSSVGSPSSPGSAGPMDNHSSPMAFENASASMSRPPSPIIMEDTSGLSSVGSLSLSGPPGSPELIDMAPEDASDFSFHDHLPMASKPFMESLLNMCFKDFSEALGGAYQKEIVRAMQQVDVAKYNELGLHPPQLFSVNEFWDKRPSNTKEYLKSLKENWESESCPIGVQKSGHTFSNDSKMLTWSTVIQQLSTPNSSFYGNIFNLKVSPNLASMKYPTLFHDLKLQEETLPVMTNITPKWTVVDIQIVFQALVGKLESGTTFIQQETEPNQLGT